MNNYEVYLDNSATTRVYSEVAELMLKVMTSDYGNPSSMHRKGMEAEQYIRYAKNVISKNLKCQPKEIIFTSGGTESDNIALIGTARANKRSGNRIITTAIEHPAILETVDYLAGEGFEIIKLPVDNFGCIRLEDLREAVDDNTILVSIMHTNNEIGSLQPIEEAGRIIKEINPHTLFHVDAVQGYGKFKIYPKRMSIDLLSVSGHKIHGPKGIGFLYIGEKVKVKPINYGGGQQSGMRSGTENVPAIAGMAKAIELIYDQLDDKMKTCYKLREFFIQELGSIEGVSINGGDEGRAAAHIVSMSVDGVRAEVLLHALEDKGVYVSSGSACATNKPAISSTLQAIGLSKNLLDSTIRFSFSFDTTKEELEYTVKCLEEIIPVLRRFVRR